MDLRMGMPTKINSALVFRVTFSKMVLICSRQFTETTSLKVGSGRANPNSLAFETAHLLVGFVVEAEDAPRDLLGRRVEAITLVRAENARSGQDAAGDASRLRRQLQAKLAQQTVAVGRLDAGHHLGHLVKVDIGRVRRLEEHLPLDVAVKLGLVEELGVLEVAQLQRQQHLLPGHLDQWQIQQAEAVLAAKVVGHCDGSALSVLKLGLVRKLVVHKAVDGVDDLSFAVLSEDLQVTDDLHLADQRQQVGETLRNDRRRLQVKVERQAKLGDAHRVDEALDKVDQTSLRRATHVGEVKELALVGGEGAANDEPKDDLEDGDDALRDDLARRGGGAVVVVERLAQGHRVHPLEAHLKGARTAVDGHLHGLAQFSAGSGGGHVEGASGVEALPAVVGVVHAGKEVGVGLDKGRHHRVGELLEKALLGVVGWTGLTGGGGGGDAGLLFEWLAALAEAHLADGHVVVVDGQSLVDDAVEVAEQRHRCARLSGGQLLRHQLPRENILQD
ncbi:hypothetical protein TYRP_002666 [Tyrophagus putrescentiae]|nr:hypothetical protein TYRP_002666 [Tyrophagus putrescentiae]